MTVMGVLNFQALKISDITYKPYIIITKQTKFKLKKLKLRYLRKIKEYTKDI